MRFAYRTYVIMYGVIIANRVIAKSVRVSYIRIARRPERTGARAVDLWRPDARDSGDVLVYIYTKIRTRIDTSCTVRTGTYRVEDRRGGGELSRRSCGRGLRPEKNSVRNLNGKFHNSFIFFQINRKRLCFNVMTINARSCVPIAVAEDRFRGKSYSEKPIPSRKGEIKYCLKRQR